MKARLLTYSLFALIFVLAYLYGSVIASRGLHNHVLVADYTGFLLGSALLAEGHAPASELYNIPIQTTVQQQLLAGSGIHFPDGLLPFVNPPYVAMLATPLYYLSPEPGFILWDGLQLAALLLSLWLLGVMLPPQHRYLFWLGAFAFLPLYQSLVQGQISPTLLLAIVLLWRSLRVGPSADGWAAASLAILLLKPQLLPPFLLYLLYRRNWRVLSGFTAISAAVYLLAALVSGWDWPFRYLDLLNWLGSHPGRYGSRPDVMLNLRGLLIRIGADSTPLLLALTALTLVALVYGWWRNDHAYTHSPLRFGMGRLDGQPTDEEGSIIDEVWRKGERVGNLELQLAAATIAAALTSFYLYTHDLTVLIFSGAALLGWAAQAGWPAWSSAALLLSLFAPLLILEGQPFDALFVLTVVAVFMALLYLLVQPRVAPNPNRPDTP